MAKGFSDQLKTLTCTLALLALNACADVTNTPGVPQNAASVEAVDEDPLEPLNRAFFRTHMVLDQIVFRPVSKVYEGVVPEVGREAVSNFLDNITSPVDFVNSVLQGDPGNSFATFWRFVLNSTLGFAGLYDFAEKEVGLNAREADFGQTLASYGVSSGAYLFLPLMGPSTVRDGVGRGVDILFDPVTWTNDSDWSIAEWAAIGIDYRTENMKAIDDLNNNSLDPYAAYRSAWIQKRSAFIREGQK